ncbi:asparagine--tRNA ligase [candidate division TA06 bacterium]|nr:asparagine--tRNA ligase [candidate division TA06 bacterium]
MKEIRIEEIGQNSEEEVTLKGWVYNKRSSGKIFFLLIRDGTGILQTVATKGALSEEIFSRIISLPLESSLWVKGTVREDGRAPGGYELVLSDVEVVHQPKEDYPIGPKDHGVAFLMEHRHLWLRSRRQHAILRVRAEVVKAIRDYFDGNGFILVDAPIFTPAACEGTTTLFETDYFGEKAYLSQSGQLYMESACFSLEKVYCFGPTFRAEKSKTRRHLTEFWMVEPEMAFAHLNDAIQLGENLVAFVVERVLERRRKELEFLGRDLTPLEKAKPPYPRLTYEEAVEFLKNKGIEMEQGEDFGAPQETALSEGFEKPLIITHFPASCKAFYMKRDPEREDLTLSFDIFSPEGYGEIMGGGEREDDLLALERKIDEDHLSKKNFEWYLDLRRYGSVPHAGFGLGLERTIGWICKLPHLRESIPFPRMLEKVYP